MPDVARDACEKDRGVTAFEPAHHGHLRNGMALPKIFAQQERIDASRVAAHDHVLIVVRENLRLNEVARTKQLGDRTCFAHRAKRALPKSVVVVDVGPLQLLAGER